MPLLKSGPSYEEAMQYPCTKVSWKACDHDTKRENMGHAQGHNRRKICAKGQDFNPNFMSFHYLRQMRQSQTLGCLSSVRDGRGEWEHSYSCELRMCEDFALPEALTWLCLLTHGHKLLPLLLPLFFETPLAHSCLNCPKDKVVTAEHLT